MADERRSEEKTPLDRALDLFVYAPLGFALSVRDQLPELADKGRARVSGDLAMAKMMGQFAVAEGEKEARKRLEGVGDLLSRLGVITPTPQPASAPRPTTAPAPAPTTSAMNGKPAPQASRGAHLAIPGYDTLSASQVVQRLAGLAVEELEAVRSYEEANRGRRTILAKAAQLQSADQ